MKRKYSTAQTMKNINPSGVQTRHNKMNAIGRAMRPAIHKQKITNNDI